MRHQATEGVIVACPDARPPAYQAVVGLARAGLLHSFLTAYYYGGEGPILASGAGSLPPDSRDGSGRSGRRHDPEIPRGRVRSAWGYDLAIRSENRLAARRHGDPAAGSHGGGPGGSIAGWRGRSAGSARRGPASSATSAQSSPCRSAGSWASPRS